MEPLAAVGLIALDIMLFGGELATGGIGWAITGPIGFLAGLAIMFLQKSSYGDDWGAAIGKGLILGILTAIPTPLPSFVTGALGVAGYIGSKKD